MPFLKKVFGKSDGGAKSKKHTGIAPNGRVEPVKPQWTDAWTRTSVHPEEVAELIKGCTMELKARGLKMPFLILPFRPTSDPSAVRTFIRNYFSPPAGVHLKGQFLLQELRLTEPMVLASVIKWCWSRLPGGVVTWDSYELFKVGESDSNMARDAFTTFIPISVESDARTQIIFDFFDLLAALAAHGKSNGLGGRKLSRYAGWWAFEHLDTGKGFNTGYRSWEKAANATSHLFFAYLRSLAPDSSKTTNGILKLPLSLQTLLQSTEYPPEPPTLMYNETTKVVMIVDTVSPTPFSLLRRTKNFEYRASDRDLQQFSQYEDPVQALTEECRRVLRSISSSNESSVSKVSDSTGLRDASWSRFEDIGFGASVDESDGDTASDMNTYTSRTRPRELARTPNSQANDLGRPTTPSWADFLSTGFVDENGQKAPSPLLLPPDKVLPPINTISQRGHSSQSHRKNLEPEIQLEPGELASINKVDLDDAFWWVWISSLAMEEPISRKAVFGRCALIETIIPGGKWLVLEEQVKGAAAAQPAPGAYIAEKKGFFSFSSRRNKLTRRKSVAKKNDVAPDLYQSIDNAQASRVTIGTDQHARIQAAAAALQQRSREQEALSNATRRGRMEDAASTKTSSVFTLQPVIMKEASPAMKWASRYDKEAIRAKYLGDQLAGRGASTDKLGLPPNGLNANGSAVSLVSAKSDSRSVRSPDFAKTPDFAQPKPLEPEQPISPAPLPDVQEEPHPVNEEAVQAAEIPLPSEPTPDAPPAEAPPPPPPAPEAPEPTPAETTVIEPEPTEIAPELPAKEPTPPPQAAPAVKFAPETDVIITSDAREHKKLKKKNQHGLKGLFGSKRVSNKEREKEKEKEKEKQEQKPIVSISEPEQLSIVAARRAALEAANQPAEPVPKTGRFVGIRGRPAQRAKEASQKPAPSPAPEAVKAPLPVPEPEVKNPREKFRDERPRTYRDDEYDKLSRVDTEEREDADREFSKFDQGPLTEQPAFAPDDDSEHTPYEPPTVPDEPAEHVATVLDQAVPEEDEPLETEEPPFSPGDLSPAQAQDRWAQIRKNAAERVAARRSEDYSRNTTDRSDEGETSGEETIESRVARIKARVAELTGNMEQTRNSVHQ